MRPIARFIGLLLVLLWGPGSSLAASLIYYGNTLYACEDGETVNSLRLISSGYDDLPDSVAVMGSSKTNVLTIYFVSKMTGKIDAEISVTLPGKAYPACWVGSAIRAFHVSEDRKTVYFIAMDDEPPGGFSLAKYTVGSREAELLRLPHKMGTPLLTCLDQDTLLIIGTPDSGVMEYNIRDSSLTQVVPLSFLYDYERRKANGSDDFGTCYLEVPGVGVYFVERSAVNIKLRRLIDRSGLDEDLSILMERDAKSKDSSGRVTLGSDSEKHLFAVIEESQRIVFLNLSQKAPPVVQTIPEGVRVGSRAPFVVLQGERGKITVINPSKPSEKTTLSIPADLDPAYSGFSVLAF